MRYVANGKDRRFRWWRLSVIVGILLAVVGVSGWFGLQRWYERNLLPADSNAPEVVFTITEGESTTGIAERLESEGVIRSSSAFVWYVNRLESGSIQAGTYRLGGFLPAQDIANILVNGRVDTELVTIPPGLRLDQIHTILVNAGFSAKEVDTAMSSRYTHPLLSNKPAKASLEGYIYPETLEITDSSTVKEILTRSFDVFSNALSPAIIDGLKDQGLTLHQGIILASIVQEEVSEPEVQRKVAQVFIKRLDEGMPLGADPTFRYAAALSGQEATPELDDPYNTRIYAGLPPGPIANFTITALEAVANPTDSDYLYFVSGDDGTTHFARTFEEHEANISRYCRELCQL